MLNPYWVTAGVYALINRAATSRAEGRAPLRRHREDHRSAAAAGGLRREDYPLDARLPARPDEKVRVCFPFPGDDSRYLVPELLDKQEPAEAAEFDRQVPQLRVPLHGGARGLLPRFIVRTHVLSEGRPRWRTGVILQFEGNLALVKADAAERQVTISVRGSSPDGRRRLLAVIRSDFDHIHSDLKGKPQEMVPVPKHPDVVIPNEKLRAFEEKGISDLPEVIGDGRCSSRCRSSSTAWTSRRHESVA